MMSILDRIFGSASDKIVKKCTPIQDKVLKLESKYSSMSDEELQSMTQQFKNSLSSGKTLDDILPDAFAVCREASFRVLRMKHFPVQVLGGIVLHQGNIAEMKTGEGKTFVATLPAYLNALSGKGVHIVTVNDYLAKRDSEWMGKVYNYLGLSVGLVLPGMSPEERQKAYNADITYGTNNEMGFDYLRDNMVGDLSRKVQRSHSFAIVDEVDSILIDEARTPLIISGQGDQSTDLYQKADAFARTLTKKVVTEHDDKTELEDESENADYIVDEKTKSVSLTERGILKAQRYFNVQNLADPENMTLSHHIDQAIRAHGLMKRDVDYVVHNGEVIIVDEFTGRLMIGRRYSNGLHQAIEAKEKVNVARENRTLATITFQNYFRMYEKLSGMTGTALTEKDEFNEIYGLEVVTIPTNKEVIRKDYPDVVYKNQNAKFNAVVDQIIECHSKGQPVLVGTVSIEKSELLSRMVKRHGIPHNVLNAKNHEKEAAYVAQAGKYGAVTIATNMAGRGTDIILGGNAEFLAKNDMASNEYTDEQIQAATSYYATEDPDVLALRTHYKSLIEKYESEIAPEAELVKKAGGLFIIGTERHESRRIDDQLRGRSGRQGDPGESRFYLALDDDLMRLFGGERVTSIMDNFDIPEDTPIESKMLTNVIESSQKKVEGRNFAIRKNVLNYDDVMNKQRETIYSQRDMVLEGKNVRSNIDQMILESIQENVYTYLSSDQSSEWNLAGLRDHYLGWLTTPNDLKYSKEELTHLSREDVINTLNQRAQSILTDKENRIGSDMMRLVERFSLLSSVDQNWMEHIDNMDELRKSIHLRSYAQHDPVVEYRKEGYAMFDEMIDTIREQTAKKVLISTIVPRKQTETNEKEAQNAGNAKRTIVKKGKIGRNDPCPCGSGKKYKNCHGRNQSK
ncbi:MAG: preprotein translocase subunit SecA [Oscillospiraceae bacterium]|nr:preprotein translocase subunit SecA [Oscillospiraceae bacterium]